MNRAQVWNWLPFVTLIASIGILVMRLADFEACFQDPESLANFAPYALKDGNAFGIRDLVNCFNVWGLDGDSRPRPVSYLFYILALKCRLALWNFVPMHPSFSPLWLATLVAGPILFYKFLRLTFDSRPLAQLGTALYLSSPALLSSGVLLFHPAKPLANVAMILTLYLAARAHVRLASPVTDNLRLPTGIALAWVLMMPLLLLADETVIFCLLVPMVWTPAYFLPRQCRWGNIGACMFHGAVLALPAVLYAVFVLVAMPRICTAFFGETFNFLDCVSRLQHPDRFGPTSVARHTTELLTAAYLPWPIVGRPVPVCTDPAWNPWGLLVVELLLCTAVLMGVRRQRTCWSIAKRAVVLAAASMAFMSFVASHHDMELVLTGYYYAGMSNILLVVCLMSVVGALAKAIACPPWAAPTLVVCLMAVQHYNFHVLSNSWREHHNFKMLGWLLQLRYNPYSTPDSLEKIRPLAFAFYRSMHAADIPEAAEGGACAAMYQMWRNREGPPLVPAPLALRDIWVISELYFLRGPYHVADLPTRADWEQLDAPAARKLQWQHVIAVGLALEHLGPTYPAMPVVGLRTAPPDNAWLAAVALGTGWGRLGYPVFSADLQQGLMDLRRQNYDLLIVETRTLTTANAVPGSWGFHHAFREAWKNGRLQPLDVQHLGEIRLVGRDLTLFGLVEGGQSKERRPRR